MKPILRLTMVRHGPTDWNVEGRIQGRTDIALSADGRKLVQQWRLPPELDGLPVWSSPLRRTRETAEILFGRDVPVAASLIEMDWGQFEGRQLRELRRELGEKLAQNEDRGFDFRPPGGESPCDVLQRVSSWAQRLDVDAAVAVTHKGVIRALIANALEWDMRGKPPIKLQWQHAHTVELFENGQMKLAAFNTALV